MAKRTPRVAPYQIGQVLYVVHGMNIVPVQVVEEVTRRTLTEGEVTSYLVRTGEDPTATVDIVELAGSRENVFRTGEELIAELTLRAKTGVTQMVSRAHEDAVKWYGNTAHESASPPPEEAQEQLPRGVRRITLPDGEEVMVTL